MGGFCDDPQPTKKKNAIKRASRWYTGKTAGRRHRGKPKMAYVMHDWVVNQPEDGVIIYVDGSQFEGSWKTDEMWDTHGYLQNWYNPCVRETYRWEEVHIGPISDVDGPIVTFGQHIPQLRQYIRETIPLLSNEELDDLAIVSETKLSTVVDMDASIVNFIIEAISACGGNIKLIKRFQKLYTAGMIEYKKAFKRFLAQGHKHSAAAWLSWNFAIKPTLKDLRAILCSFNNTFKRLEWLRKHNHKVTYKTYARDMSDSVSFPFAWLPAGDLCAVTRAEIEGPGTYPNGLYRLEYAYDDVKVKYVAKSKFELELPDYLVDGGKGAGAMWAALQGITNPISIVWEAIPFSWLIDYFLAERLKLFTKRYDFSPFNEGVRNCGYGHSFDITATCRVRLFNVTNGVVQQELGTVEYRIYSRRAGLPYPEQFALYRIPGDWYHGSILSALCVGFFPNRRRKGRR